MTRGIYQIRNTENGRVYIGSSINIEKRITAHKLTISRRPHQLNSEIRKDVLEFGPGVFVFEIVEEVPLGDNILLSEREIFWTRQAHASLGGCYNSARCYPRAHTPGDPLCSKCDRKHYAKGLCHFHYTEARRPKKPVAIPLSDDDLLIIRKLEEMGYGGSKEAIIGRAVREALATSFQNSL